jgi:hypothetical protein
MTRHSICLIAVAALLLGCGASSTGGDTPLPAPAPTDIALTCEQGGPCPAGTMVGFWRIVLERSVSGDVKVLGHEHYEADAGAGTPLSSAAPTHAVVAYDASGTIVASAPVSFPTTILYENHVTFEQQRRKLDKSVTVVSLRAPSSTTHLALVDARMKELQRIDGGELKRQTLRQRSREIEWAAESPRVGNWLAQIDPSVVAARRNCPHVYIMEEPAGPSPLNQATHALFGGNQPKPTKTQLKQAFLALQYLSPLQCRALRAIAFVAREDNTGLLGWQTSYSGGLVFLNSAAFTDDILLNGTPQVSRERWQAETRRTIVHEATHALQDLLDQGNIEMELQRDWPSNVRVDAQEILDTQMFPKGNFIQEWKRTHRTFVGLDLAAEPYEDVRSVLKNNDESGEVLAKAGFMTAYGATSYHDDIAEIASIVQTQELFQQFPESERRDYICKALRRMDTKYVPSTYVAGFTKLGFLRSLGVIEERHYDSCVGKAKLPDFGTGVHSVREDGSRRSYDKNITQAVQFVNGRGGIYGRYQLIAEGLIKLGDKEGDGQFRMEVDTGPKATEVPPIPRGIYQVKGGWIGQRTRIKGEAAGHWGRFQVDLGWIIITEASRERMRGFIEVRKASRPTAFGANVGNLPDRIFFDIPKSR